MQTAAALAVTELRNSAKPQRARSPGPSDELRLLGQRAAALRGEAIWRVVACILRNPFPSPHRTRKSDAAAPTEDDVRTD